jgi:hypothetical protein
MADAFTSCGDNASMASAIRGRRLAKLKLHAWPRPVEVRRSAAAARALPFGRQNICRSTLNMLQITSDLDHNQ